MFVEKLWSYKWLITAIVILLGNMIAYQLSFIDTLSVEQARGMVVGSLIDCAIIAPALVLLHTRKWSLKKGIIFAAGGIVIARIIIPASFIEPFRYLTWSAFAVEASLIAFELMLLFIFVKYVPTIIRTVNLKICVNLINFYGKFYFST